MTEEIKQPIKSEIELIREERKELEAENDLYDAEKLRAQKLRAEKLMSGRTEVIKVVEKSQEEKDTEQASNYAKKLFGR